MWNSPKKEYSFLSTLVDGLVHLRAQVAKGTVENFV
jgi:hypothetical protein